jgi:hypothetical protein
MSTDLSLEVKRNESNFVYYDYKLILELAQDMHWFWRAWIDAHGTTTNNLVMCKPEKWKRYIIKDGEAAQWTSVQTIPRTVANAMQNQVVHIVH